MTIRVDYRQVADIYIAAQRGGKPPVIAVATELGLRYSAAAGRVRRARELGFLSNEQSPHVPTVRPPLSSDRKQAARKLFSEGEGCEYCGGLHTRVCPRLKSMTLEPDTRKTLSVEFWPPGTWPEDGIIWLEDVMDIEEDD